MHKVTFYGLSTCGWCRRTKRFLDAHGVDYELIYVDLLTGAERQRIMNEVSRWNPRLTFPTVVVDGKLTVIGYSEERLREALGL
ncbi:MAG: glutaredoxin family protein [Anaerolineae bacterium]|nr:glutaredoxin family protein [Anaerolineae bacterium]